MLSFRPNSHASKASVRLIEYTRGMYSIDYSCARFLVRPESGSSKVGDAGSICNLQRRLPEATTKALVATPLVPTITATRVAEPVAPQVFGI